MMSAEELPSGESTQARCLIVPVSAPLHGPGDVRRPDYNHAETLARDGVYAKAMAGYIQHIASHRADIVLSSQRYRDHLQRHESQFSGEHPRTGQACAELSYGWRVFLDFAVACGAITEVQSNAQWKRVVVGLQAVAGNQHTYHEDQKPVGRTLDLLIGLFAQRRIHLMDQQTGGHPQRNAEQAGWVRDVRPDSNGEVDESFRLPPGSVMVGWVGYDGQRTWGYFLRDAIYEQLQEVCRRQQTSLPDKTQLWKTLREALEPLGLMRCSREQTKTGVVTRTTHKISVSGEEKQMAVLALAFPLNGLVEPARAEFPEPTPQAANPDIPVLPAETRLVRNSENQDSVGRGASAPRKSQTF